MKKNTGKKPAVKPKKPSPDKKNNVSTPDARTLAQNTTPFELASIVAASGRVMDKKTASECLDLIFTCASIISERERARLERIPEDEQFWEMVRENDEKFGYFLEPRNYPIPHARFIAELKLPKDGLVINGKKIKGIELFRLYAKNNSDFWRKRSPDRPTIDDILPEIERTGWKSGQHGDCEMHASGFLNWYAERVAEAKKRTAKNLRKKA